MQVAPFNHLPGMCRERNQSDGCCQFHAHVDAALKRMTLMACREQTGIIRSKLSVKDSNAERSTHGAQHMVDEYTVQNHFRHKKGRHDRGSHLDMASQQHAQKQQENVANEITVQSLLANVVDVDRNRIMGNAEGGDDYTLGSRNCTNTTARSNTSPSRK